MGAGKYPVFDGRLAVLTTADFDIRRATYGVFDPVLTDGRNLPALGQLLRQLGFAAPGHK